MTQPLVSYRDIQIGLFCKLTILSYKVEPTDIPIEKILLFSTMDRTVVIGSDVYQPLGNFLDITDSSSNIRATSDQMTLSISGIPTNSIKEILNSKIKGSKIEIIRKFFNPITGASLGVTTGRFTGIVNNYNLAEDFNSLDQIATNTIVLTCSSSIDILMNKIGGRRTNGIDQKALYPTDVSLDRVTTLANSNFNFGAPVK